MRNSGDRARDPKARVASRGVALRAILAWPQWARAGQRHWLGLAAVFWMLAVSATPAAAQYSLGTSTTPFTTPGQTITLTYILSNASGIDANVTVTAQGQLGAPSCVNPVLVPAGTTKDCTFTYPTSLTDVAASKFTVASQWSFCSATSCASTYTDNNILTVAYQGAPVITGAMLAVPYASPGTQIDLSGHITGQTSGVSLASPPSHGSVAVSGTVMIYTPATSFYGSDSFTYSAIGPSGVSNPAIVNVTVANPPAPTATAATATVTYNSAANAIDLASKVSGVATALAVAQSPAHGTVAVSGTIASYTPTTGYSGADSFTYAATGPGGTSAPAAVSLVVGLPPGPTVTGAAATIPFNSPGTPIDLTSKISGVVTSIGIGAAPRHGTVTTSGTVATFTPATGYSGPDSFTYTATGPGGTSQSGTVSLTVAPQVVIGGTVTIKVATPGSDGTFGFVTSFPGASTFALATTVGTATRVLTSVPVGTQSIVLTSLPAGQQVQSVQCTAGTVTGDTATLTITNGATITCTFATIALTGSPAVIASAIRTFMRNRANAVMAEPDTSRRHGRVSGNDDEPAPALAAKAPVSGPGAGAGPLASGGQQGAGRFAHSVVAGVPASDTARSQPMTFTGSVVDGNGQMNFTTSLSQVRQAARDNENQRRMAAGLAPETPAPVGAGRPVLFDIWLEGHTTMYSDNSSGGKRRGNVDMLYLGADYLITKRVLVGALVQFDRAHESSSVLGTDADGTGWMAGPYMTARLDKNVFFDARAAWGQSANQVTTPGSAQDQFATRRALASAKLSGDWKSGAWRITPSAELVYYQEQQKAFASIGGGAVPGQTLAIGRLSLGPELGYKIKTGDGGVLEPYGSLKALWDFKRDTTVAIGGMDVGTAALRGKAEAGAAFTTKDGIAIKAAASYDGLGDKVYHAMEGKLSVRIPLP